MLEKRYMKVDKPTSIGFLLPLDEADKYCIKKIVNDNNENK